MVVQLSGKFSPIGSLPFSAFLRLKSPFATNFNHRTVFAQGVQQQRHLAAKVRFAGQVLGQQVGDGFRLGVHTVQISFSGYPPQHVDQHEDAGFQGVIALAAAQRLDAVSRLGGSRPALNASSAKRL